jgi:2-methylisocitrate lyase-like PEP mutase family enzyme
MTDRFADFRDAHHADRPLLLPNAWDHASAAILAGAGYSAIGTTSLGVAASAGLPDATGATRAQTLALARRLAGLPCAITVDIESGFGGGPSEVADLVAELESFGVVGVNLEDGQADGSLADAGRQAETIAAVKQRAPRVFLNARTDTHWLGVDRPLDSALERASRYRAAGADGIFVPGVTDGIADLVSGIDAPLNVLFSPNGPSLAELTALGVARVSTGSLLFRAALGAIIDTIAAVQTGSALAGNLPTYAEATALSDCETPLLSRHDSR